MSENTAGEGGGQGRTPPPPRCAVEPPNPTGDQMRGAPVHLMLTHQRSNEAGKQAFLLSGARSVIARASRKPRGPGGSGCVWPTRPGFETRRKRSGGPVSSRRPPRTCSPTFAGVIGLGALFAVLLPTYQLNHSLRPKVRERIGLPEGRARYLAVCMSPRRCRGPRHFGRRFLESTPQLPGPVSCLRPEGVSTKTCQL